MKPKELLIARLQEHIVPFMETHGFRFSKSQLHFTRKIGQVYQRIELCLDRHNTTDNCTLWTMQVWGPGHATDSHLLRVNISTLRQKLEADPAHPAYIVTEPRIGYRLRVDQ